MSADLQPISPNRKIAGARKLALLSSVAAIGIAVLVAGPFTYNRASIISSPAVAAETTMQPTGFADMVAKVKPAVIGIQVKIERSADEQAQNGNGLPVEPGSPLDKFLKEYGFSGMPNAMPHRRQMITGEGSGFFISSDGYAVTNYHVVDHAKTVQVTTDDGTKYTAKVVGTDQKTDLALIKVDGSNFPSVQFASHEARVGDWVVAVGNPFGLGGTVTAGIVSARGRDIGAGPYDDYIQIDAPINKGNSGGPAFNINGEVVGINTAIYSPSGGSVGIGFDIPADTAKMVVAQLKDKGHVTRGWIGVQIQPVTPGIASSLGMKQAQGAIVDEPQPNSPAAKAGIEIGDVITALNGTPVKDSRDLARKIGMMAPGTTVTLDVLHKGQSKDLKLTLGEMPNVHQAKAETQTAPADSPTGLGLMLAPAYDVAGYGSKGLVVTGVEPESSAADQGIKTGDVILDVSGAPVSNVTDIRKALAAAKAQGKHDILMRVKTGDATRFIALPFGRA